MKAIKTQFTALFMFVFVFFAAGIGTAKAADITFIKLEYTFDTKVYQALLIKDKESGNGLMRVRYFEEATQRQKIVQMAMTLEHTTKGIVLKGGPATDARTGAKVPGYASDNLIVRTHPDGTTTLHNVDARGNVSETDAQTVTDTNEVVRLLKEFNWENLLRSSPPEEEEPRPRNRVRF